MKRRGRPPTSRLDRAGQLRRAKQRQRARDRANGLRLVQLQLPAATATKLATAARDPDFPQSFDRLLDQAVVRISDYPALRQIAWNRSDDYLPARDAFALYERNWRWVDHDTLIPTERELIDRLKSRFGSGILHA